MDEIFDLVDGTDNIIGTVMRSEAHGDPEKIHRVAHVLVFSSKGELFLQKRASDKDVQPGKWDTSVGGHLDRGESYEQAAARELSEELGVNGGQNLVFLYKYLHRNEYEAEYVSTYSFVWNGPFVLQESEIEDGRFWTLEEIAAKKSSGIFTPNFLDELERFKSLRE